MAQPTSPQWRKSSRSGSQSNCVEVAGTLDRVRDSKAPGAGVVRTSPAALSRFLDAVRRDRF